MPTSTVRNSPEETPRAHKGMMSLRAKGVISLMVVIVYLGLAAIVVMAERGMAFSIIHGLDRTHGQEDFLGQVNILLSRSIMATNEEYLSPTPGAGMRNVMVEAAALENMLVNLRAHSNVRVNTQRFSMLIRELAENPSKGVLAELRREMNGFAIELDRATQAVRAEKDKLLTNYRETNDKITLEILAFVFLGIVVSGAIVTLFFSRLTWDIRRVRSRAMAIVKGYRGKPLEVTRGDEVGGLMEAVNRMQMELRERETQLEISRQQHFHKEKMAAVGSLAAAFAHEINNPIMAICGLSEQMIERGTDAGAEGDGDQPRMILDHAVRISQITRQMAQMSNPRSLEPRLSDLNEIVQSTCQFLRFDQRLRGVDLAVDCDRNLPAVHLVADHIAQILINLLLNAADAIDAQPGRRPKVTVQTRQLADSVEVAVSDNGSGMDTTTLAHACEEFFTTKPSGAGSGLGLFICKTLVERGGGELTIESEPGKGTVVRFSLPIDLAEIEQEEGERVN